SPYTHMTLKDSPTIRSDARIPPAQLIPPQNRISGITKGFSYPIMDEGARGSPMYWNVATELCNRRTVGTYRFYSEVHHAPTRVTGGELLARFRPSYLG